jgi:hypothetical protein
MVRLGSAALLFLSLPAAAWSNPPDRSRSYQLSPASSHLRFVADATVVRAEIAPNAHLGFGMFGLKSEKALLQPATGREIDMRKQRRAAVGISLKF